MGRGLRPQADDVDGARKSKLRIVRVADVPSVATAGMSGFMLSSAKEMEQQGHRVSFWFRDQLMPRCASARLRRLFVPWLIVAKVVSAIRAGERFDIIEIHEPLAGPYALVARLAGGARLPACAVLSFGLEERGWAARLAHLHANGDTAPLRSRLLVPLTLLLPARVGLRNAEAVLVPSSADRDYAIGRLGVPAERVSCCFTGVSEHMFGVQRTAHNEIRLLFLGSWIDRKGVGDLTAAWLRLAGERSDVRLTVAGVGDAQRARADVKHLPRVDVIASVAREELPGLLAAHDLFVLPSWFEGMPLSMLEAAAAGLPCVVCAVCGNLDVFRPADPQNDGAVLVPPSESVALYRALLALVDDGELRDALGQRARERARHFTWARSSHQAISAYAAAIERRGGRPVPR